MNAAGTSPVNTAANYRMGLIGAAAAPAPGGPIVWRAGVLSSAGTSTGNTDLSVSQTGTASASVLVAPGTCVIPRAGAAGGPYLVTFTSTSTVVGDPASSTNPRIDVLAVQVIDAAIGDSGTQGGQLFIVNGTPGASPAVPAIPTGALALAQMLRATNVNPITTANITDVRKSSAMGGIRALLPGDLTGDAGSFVGEYTHDAVTALKSGLRYWDGSVWRGVKPSVKTPAWANGTSNITIPTTSVNLATCTVADPGYPYLLRVSAQIDWNGYPTFTAGSPPYVALRLTLDSVGGTGIGSANGFAAWTNSSLDSWTGFPSHTTGPYTGAHTVYLNAFAGGMASCVAPYAGWLTGTFLDVEVIPS
jgi:hypothetical protein